MKLKLSYQKLNQRLKKLLKKTFEETVGTKEKFIADTKNVAKNDLEALLKRKIPQGKLLGWVAGGVAALALLGYAIAPKNKEV